MSYFDDNEDRLIYGAFHDPFTHDKGKVCSHCGMSDLRWEDYGSGWKLYDENDKKHVCPSQVPSADDFDVLT